jgi:hypothetical protein
MHIKKYLKMALLLTSTGVIFLLFFYFNPSQNAFFIPCPVKYTTGYYCPGCGSQRALHQLTHLHVYNAFRLNPLLILSLPILIFSLGVTVWNWIFNTSYRVKLFYNNLFIYFYFGIVLLYWIARNISFYPFNLLAPTAP